MERIIRILAYRNREDLARLLRSSSYDIRESDTYGSRLFSKLSTVIVYSPIDTHEKLRKLSNQDGHIILDAFLEIHPPEDYGAELNNIEFHLDTDAPIPEPITHQERLSQIDFEYIHDQISKSNERINIGDFEGAITNARTLVENVCIYILDKSGIEYKHEGDLPKLYKKVSQLLNMEPQSYSERLFKEILSGCISVVNGLSNIRNKLGDAHGKSKTGYYTPSKRHAIFAVEVAKAFSEFLFSTYADRIKKD